MNKMHRTGHEIQLAIKSGLRSLLPKRAPLAASPFLSALASTAEPPPALPKGAVLAALREFEGRFRGAIRPVLGSAAARAKSVLSTALAPGWRTKAPDSGSIKEELLREIRAGHLAMQRELQALVPRLDRLEQYSDAAARRVAIPCEAGETLIKTRLGFLLCPAGDHGLLIRLIESGEVDAGTRQLIQKFLKPGDTYVDVGAHIGAHTIAAAQALQGRGKVFAFEPFEPARKMLEKSALINGVSSIVEVHQAAVSEAAGWRQLNLGVASARHSFYQPDLPDRHPKMYVDVPLVRLDQAIPIDQKVELLKIDVEGAELEVLAGSEALLIANPDLALLVEFAPSLLRRASNTVEQWLGRFAQLGLVWRVVNPMTGLLDDCSADELAQSERAKLFFAKPESTAWARLRA